MRYRSLGKTGLQVSELSLGTVALGMPYGLGARSKQSSGAIKGVAPPSDTDATRLIQHAIEQGINFFDTARDYGNSEEILGRALRSERQNLLIATKISCHDAGGKLLPKSTLVQHMSDSLHTSLSLLQTDYVDLLMLHNATVELLENSPALETLRSFQAQGKARYLGASTYGLEAPRIAIGKPFDALQVAFNILDQRMADEIFPLATAAGIGVIVRSVFLKGALTPSIDYFPPHLGRLKTYSEAVKQGAAKSKPAMNRIEAALKFVLAQAEISTALLGTRDIAELDFALAVARGEILSADLLARFKELRCDEPDLLDPSRWGLP